MIYSQEQIKVWGTRQEESEGRLAEQVKVKGEGEVGLPGWIRLLSG